MAATVENPPAKILNPGSKIPRTRNLKTQGYLDLAAPSIRMLPLMPEQTLPAVKLSRAEALLKAKDAFDKALALTDGDPLLAAKATLGLASVAEDRENWDEARQIYQTMTDPKGKFVGTPFGRDCRGAWPRWRIGVMRHP